MTNWGIPALFKVQRKIAHALGSSTAVLLLCSLSACPGWAGPPPPSLGQNSPAREKQVPDINPLQVSGLLKPRVIEPEQIVELELKLHLLPDFKAYEDQFRLEVESGSGFKVARTHLSPLIEFYDSFSKRNRRGLVGSGELVAAIGVPADLPDGPLRLRLTYQACTKTYCLFPKTIPLEISYEVKRSDSVPTRILPTTSGANENLFHGNLLWTFVAVFFAGVLTSFTPCIFPMIPITLAVLVKDAHLRTRLQSFNRSVAYVLGIAVTYSLLGLLAALTGALFGSAMSSPWVLGTICFVFLAMSLSLFGFYDLEPPQALQQRLSGASRLTGPLGAFVTGLISGIVASPCVGPVLVGILTYVAQTQDTVLGFSLLFVFALGMGQIFLFLGAFTNLTRKLPRSGPWLNLVKSFSGLMMLGTFYYFLSLLLPLRAFDAALGIGLIILGSLGGAFLRELPTAGWAAIIARLQKGFGWAALIFGSVLAVISAFDLRPQLSTTTVSGFPLPSNPSTAVRELNWTPLTDASLSAVLGKGKPVLIDFFADWCAACHELDQITFRDETVRKLLQEKFEILRFDATRDSAELKNFRQRYGIVGLPWIVLIDAHGNPRTDLTLTEFEEPVLFARRLQKLAP